MKHWNSDNQAGKLLALGESSSFDTTIAMAGLQSFPGAGLGTESSVVPTPVKTDIRALTGLRGAAACMVVLFHYFWFSKNLGVFRAPLLHGYISVDLFFVLSGYVMALTYGKDFTRRFSFSTYISFLGKRFSRLYPLYIVMTLVSAVLLSAHLLRGATPSLATMTINAFMVQTWGVARSVVGPAWSLSTEVAAYFLFPLFVATMLKGKAASWGAALGAILVLLVISNLSSTYLNQEINGLVFRSGALDVHGPSTDLPLLNPTLFPLLRCFGGFTLGLAAFRLSRQPAIIRIARFRHMGDVAALIVVILWATKGTDVLLVCMFVPLVITLAVADSITSRILAAPIAVWLGEISYSLYLVHGAVLELTRVQAQRSLEVWHVPHAFSFSSVIPLALAIALSAASFYGLEKPARNWLRRMMGSRPPPIEAEPSAP